MRKFDSMPHRIDLTRSAPDVGQATDVPLAGTRAQSVQRLQIGIGGVVLMVLLVGLASLIQDRTRQVDAASVPGAAPTTEPSVAPQQQDPLVDAGVVPDLPEGPSDQGSRPAGSPSPQMPPDAPPPQP